MTDHPTTLPGDDDRLLALSRVGDRARREAKAAREEAAETSREVKEIDALVRELAGSLASLARTVAGSESPEEGSSRAWLQVADPGAAREMLADLVGWVDEVLLRYPGVELPACWAFHPWVIEELWWLRRAHADAYAGKSPAWAKAGDWHDRQRPGVVRRISDAIGGCELDEHKPDRPEEPRAIAAPLAGHLEHIADAWTSTGLPPRPTDAQLAEAEQYDAQRNRLSTI